MRRTDGVVTTDGTRGRRKWVSGAEENTASLDSVTSFPDHGTDRSTGHIYDFLAPLMYFQVDRTYT
jgi:hypothetical protein